MFFSESSSDKFSLLTVSHHFSEIYCNVFRFQNLINLEGFFKLINVPVHLFGKLDSREPVAELGIYSDQYHLNLFSPFHVS